MKKTISAIITVISVLIFAVFANAAELSGEAKRELYDYGIMIGDENGDLRLNDTITRAEAVKMLCTLGNLDTELLSEDDFPDVEKTHWAYKYISAARYAGIINGDENGFFNPEADITNEEIVKTLVCLLGFEPLAEQRGGYPAGYTAVASMFNVTKDLQLDVNTAAIRNDVAVMVYNALDIPIMMGVPSADNYNYMIMDGINGYPKITLRDSFKNK